MLLPLTHRGNVLDDTNELIEDSLAGDIALIDGITTADCLESVIWPILTGLPLHLGDDRASCEGEIGATGLDDGLIKLDECTGSKIGPAVGGIEDAVDSAYKVDRLVIVNPARFGIIVGDLSEM